MRIVICVMLVTLPALKFFGQGVEFDKIHSWAEIKTRARQERKYIFLAFTSTKNAQCKWRDRGVYPTKELEPISDSLSVSVRVQIDSILNDDPIINKWHADAAGLHQKFAVTNLPIYLFFSPDCDVIHKGVERLFAADLLRLFNEATDPGQQFFTLLRAYQKNQLDYSLLLVLSKQATIFRDRSFTAKTGEKYLSAYIEKLGEPILYNRETLLFISPYLSAKHRIAFAFFSKHLGMVDSIVGRRDFALNTNEFIISVQEIQKKIVQDGDWKEVPLVTNPSWTLLRQNIARKYPAIKAEKLILQAKITWYKQKKDWLEATKARLPFYEKYLTMPEPGFEMIFSMGMNNALDNEVFQNTDTALLIRASKMQKKFILDLETEKDQAASKANSIDTYANLLYKAGLVSEAISWQTEATLLDPASSEFSDSLDKMRNGAPTCKTVNPIKPNEQ